MAEGGANVFNTFSFNKWADGRREEAIDKESRRRRAEQIRRLKERLRKERALREAGGDGDLDLEALIEALQRGEVINDGPPPMTTTTTTTTAMQENSQKSTSNSSNSTKDPDELDDDYILHEIREYAAHHPTGNGPSSSTPDPRFWQYNRRYGVEMERPQEVREAPKAVQRLPSTTFKYNRIIANN